MAETYRPAAGLATIAVLFCAGPIAARAQEPPDPTAEVPKVPCVLATEPHWTCEPIGLMYFPKGKLRSVTWSHEVPTGTGPFDQQPRPPEKRAVLTFDDRGRCIRAESWCMGVLESRRVIEPLESFAGERVIVQWTPGEPEYVREPLRTSDGLEIAMLQSNWRAKDDPSVPDEAVIFAEHRYDSRGRLLLSLFRGWSEPYVPRVVEYWRDETGRAVRVDHGGVPDIRGFLEEFQYDGQGRIATWTRSYDGASYVRVLEYVYDEAGRILDQCESFKGELISTIHCRYGTDGRLVARTTIEEGLQDDWLGEPVRRTEEIFDGVDRMLRSTVFTVDGIVIEDVTWAYEDDVRGNWVRKIPTATSNPDRLEWVRSDHLQIFREIEYAD